MTTVSRKRLALELGPPSGPIRFKYHDFVTNDHFAEMGMVGPFNTAKSTAAIDRLTRRAVEYPGSNALIARATLVALKDSTLEKLRARVGAMFDRGAGGSENLQEAVFRLPPEAHPVTGQAVQSTINGIGLDRNDIERVLKSTEYATVHLEEANEIPSDAHDLVMERTRQEIYHRSKTVRTMCMELAALWSRLAPRTLTWQDVYQILLDDRLNRVGERQLASDHPMPGAGSVTATWNPEGNEHSWVRYVGVPYPYPAPTEEWVRENVGVREVHVPPHVLAADRFAFRAGALVQLPSGERSFVTRHDRAAKTVRLVNGEVISEEKATLVLQRYCIYVFGHENESRDHRNVENSYLMANQEMRLKHQHGHSTEREGRVLSPYIDEPLGQGGHVLPSVPRERIARSGHTIIAGIDHGGDHATAIVFAMYLERSDSLIFFDEIVKSGESAYAMATEAKQQMIPGLTHIWGYDPAMNARLFDRDASHRIVDNYIEVLGDNLFEGPRGDPAYDELARMMLFEDTFLTPQPMPRVMVTENCHQIRNAFLNLSWRMVRRQRYDWRVDVGDACKIAAGIVRKGFARHHDIDADFTPRKAYSDRFRQVGV